MKRQTPTAKACRGSERLAGEEREAFVLEGLAFRIFLQTERFTGFVDERFPAGVRLDQCFGGRIEAVVAELGERSISREDDHCVEAAGLQVGSDVGEPFFRFRRLEEVHAKDGEDRVPAMVSDTEVPHVA